MLQKIMDKCIAKGHNVIMIGDYNTPLNDRENQPKMWQQKNYWNGKKKAKSES